MMTRSAVHTFTAELAAYAAQRGRPGRDVGWVLGHLSQLRGLTETGVRLGLAAAWEREEREKGEGQRRRGGRPILDERAAVARDVERLGLRGAIDGLREGRR